MREWRVTTAAAAETDALGRLLGALLPTGTTVLLYGDLGAGKTALARGIARGFGVPEEEPVTSPSYTLMNQYRGRGELNHFDLYRLGDVDELEQLGFADYLSGGGVTLVEWAERAPGCERDALEIHIEAPEMEERVLTVIAHGDEQERLLAEWAQRWAQERR